MTPSIAQIQVAHDDRDALQAMIDTLLAERLIACGQIVGPVSSTYEWQGHVERAQPEWLAFLKTTTAVADDLIRRIEELHAYEVPEILLVEVAGGHGPYLEWVAAQTS
ncbi:MAG TPA: divalent-cation tolerance protein CutA [Solirubrobacteraceae bacterium]|nr:divalent-cation tolerance protein CutA [Solirubrobacteraceae bacterium]